ncbi:hypothetical protein BGZ99_000486 [Dissophora globulifera]|uniref:CHY-type domain-containing protein n=1 Tax=Dissophora globulifera TaxID=979702 RepID=A0A9P6RUU1_9FUNG|nr:hypothetical protein BGZ99_000486 [Dissophora globulifera]
MATTNAARAPVRKPTPRQLQNLSKDQQATSVRAFEISQVQSRFKSSSFRTSDSPEGDDTLHLKIVPSDPDFPYDIESLHIELIIPKAYPQQACGVRVLNKDIPVGFTTNLERGFAEAARQKKALLAHLNWLDVNMEQLLQKPAVSTIRFVGHGQQSAAETKPSAPSLPPPLPTTTQSTTTPAAAASSASTSTAAAKSTTPQQQQQQQQRQRQQQLKSSPINSAPAAKPAKKHYTIQQLEQASAQRQKQVNQIQARFRSTFAAMSVTEFQIGLESVNQTQKMPVSWEGPLWIHLLVPSIFPLEPCEIRLKQDGRNPEIELWRARNVEQGFRKIVAASPQLSLFQLLNQLNRDLKEFLAMAPQSDTHTNNASSTSASSTANIPTPVTPAPAQGSSVVNPTPSSSSSSSSAPKAPRTRGFGHKDDIDSHHDKKVIYIDAPAPRRNFEQDDDHGAVTSEDDDDDDDDDEGEEDSDEAEEGVSDSETKEQDGSGAESTDKGNDNDDSADEETAVRGPAVDTTAPKRGIEIRMPDLKLDHISLLYCRSLNVLVRCNRCKGLFEIAELQPDDSSSNAKSSSASASSGDKRKWRTCENCQSLMGAHFRTEYIHMQSRTVGYLDLAGCTAFDILPSAFVPTCSECDQVLGSASTEGGQASTTTVAEAVSDSEETTTSSAERSRSGPSSAQQAPTGFRQRVGRGMSATANCRTCHVRMTFSMEGEVKFVKLSPGDMMKASASDLEQLPLRKKKIGGAGNRKNGGLDFELKVGEPLPRKGACDHYKKSRRWFRFPCCSKIYPCHLCHDEKEPDHESEFAKRMICGHCSREQTVSDKPCICGESPVRTTGGSGAFWEGGEGMRDKTKMSHKDPKKHKGLNKTVAKKQVGAENIRKRASKAAPKTQNK